MDLTDMIASDDARLARQLPLPAAYADFTVDGKPDRLPRETTGTILIYNKSLFDQHGLAAPTATGVRKSS
ncbi:MAG: hypothetical protein R2851_23040 [Caldilineaceae bacterium]